MTITLDPGGAEVSGRVLDATGGAVAGASVSLSQPGINVAAAHAASDDTGQFTLYAPAGELDVLASADGYTKTMRRVRSPTAGLQLVLAPSAEIAGRVVTADTQEPVSDMSVTATPQGGTDELPVSVRSDDGGEFRLAGLAGGAYELVASSSQMRSAGQWVALDVGSAHPFVVLSVVPATVLTGSVWVADKPCPDATVEMTGASGWLARPAAGGAVRFEGLLPGIHRVVVQCPQALTQTEEIEVGTEPVTRRWTLQQGLSVDGEVENAQGRPLPNARVKVQRVDLPAGNGGGSCVSDEAGRFSCAGLALGEYECSLDGFERPASNVARISLQEGRTAHVLLRAHGLGTIRASLRGTDESKGRPFRVFARGASPFPIEAARQGEEFVFEGMALGRYDIYVDLPTASMAPTAAVLEHDGQVLELRLPVPPSAAIAGRAVDDDGEPLVDAWVRASPSDRLATAGSSSSNPPALTDERGEFTLTGLVPGAYDLHVANSLGEAQQSGVAAGAVEVLIRLERQAGASNQPAPEAAEPR